MKRDEWLLGLGQENGDDFLMSSELLWEEDKNVESKVDGLMTFKGTIACKL